MSTAVPGSATTRMEGCTDMPLMTQHAEDTMVQPPGPAHDAGASDIPVLELIEPLAGFADHRSFALVRLDDEGTVCELQSTERPDLSFLVVPPHVFFPHYAPEIDDTTMKILDLRSAEDVLLLVMINPGPSLAETTANLLAPVLVNHRTRRGAQVVLDDDSQPLRASLAGG